MFKTKIYDEPESPNTRRVFKIYEEPESPNEGECLRCVMNRKRQVRRRVVEK